MQQSNPHPTTSTADVAYARLTCAYIAGTITYEEWLAATRQVLRCVR